MSTTTSNPGDNEVEHEPVIVAAVEGGGTSFKVAVCQILPAAESSSSQQQEVILPKILHRTTIDSSHDNPQRTLQQCADFLLRHKPATTKTGGGYSALGLATFGPVGVNVSDPQNYGCILSSTPKAAWRNVNLLEPLRRACQGDDKSQQLKVRVDTDVNAPALAEYRYANSHTETKKKISSVAYVTVGTGVGVGLIVNDKPVHGRMHPEGGHVLALPLPDDQFTGYSWGKDMSPFQGIHTIEGLACSVSLTERLQQMNNNDTASLLSRSVLADLPDDHEVWVHAANALACLSVNLLLTLSIEKIVFGGGIMLRKGLIEKIRSLTVKHLNGYLELPTDMSDLITLSTYGGDAGLVGAITLAQQALKGDDEISPEQQERETQMKKVAFDVGLWHGIIVGAVAAGLVCKYVLFAPSKRSRR